MNRFSHTLMLAIVTSALLSGCASISNDSEIVEVQKSLDAGNYKTAYFELLNLKSDPSSKMQKKYRYFITAVPLTPSPSGRGLGRGNQTG